MRRADLDQVMAIGRDPCLSRWSRHQFATELQVINGLQLVAVILETGQIAGYLISRYIAGEGELLHLGVHSGSRRQGVGTGLVTRLCGWLTHKGASACYLEVRRSNRAARSLYLQCGFQVEGIRPNYYRTSREDAVLMRWAGMTEPGQDNLRKCPKKTQV